MTMRTLAIALLLSVVGVADGERDNQEDNVRRIPPPGIAVPEKDKAELSAGVEKLGKEIEARGHDFLIVEREFRRGNRAIPDEASIRIDLYLAGEKTRT